MEIDKLEDLKFEGKWSGHIEELRESSWELEERSIDSIAQAVGDALTRWSDPEFELRKEALERIPDEFSLRESSVRDSMENIAEIFTEENVRKIVDSHLYDRSLLDGWCEREPYNGLVKAVGPDVTLNILPSNSLEYVASTMVKSILVKSSSLNKVSKSGWIFPQLFRESFKEVDRSIYESMSLVWWERGEVNREVVSDVDVVTVTGDRPVVEYYRDICSGFDARLITHGSYIGICILDLDSSEPEELAVSLAYDIASGDQMTCFSPRFVVCKGTEDQIEGFSQEVYEALESMEEENPRRDLGITGSQTLNEYLDEKMFEDDTEIIAESDRKFGVIINRTGEIGSVPIGRFAEIIPAESMEELVSVLEDIEYPVQTVTLDSETLNRDELLSRISKSCTRITKVGESEHSSPGEPHDGSFDLSSYVKWVSLERS